MHEGAVTFFVEDGEEFIPRLFAELEVPDDYVEYIKRSWETDEHTIYGRFDFLFDGASPPKLLEYNADTPTSLVEASVIQWQWLEQRGKYFP